MRRAPNQYIASLASGYGLMLLQVILALVQIPLALKHLGSAQFGIWVLCAQVAMWLQMIDAGLNGSLARHLIEYRQDVAQKSQLYACISTGFRIFCVQGILVFMASLTVRNMGEGMFNLNPEDQVKFSGVILILGLGAAAAFPLKVIYSWLFASQRIDLCNYVALGFVLVEFFVFWILLQAGTGVCSFAWARLVATIIQGGVYLWIVIRRGEFPFDALSAPWDKVMFRKLASFGGGMFVLTIGNLLLTMTQMSLVSRYLGIAYAAVWATAPKLFQLGFQVVTKIWDYRMPHLASLMDRQNDERLMVEFLSIVKGSCYLAGGGLGVLAAVNADFLEVWTNREIQWSHDQDILLAVYIFSTLIIRCITDLVFQSKIGRWLPALMLAEGIVFVALAAWSIPGFGIAGMILASLVSGVMFRLPYSVAVFKARYAAANGVFKRVLLHVVAGLMAGVIFYLIVCNARIAYFDGSATTIFVGKLLVGVLLLFPFTLLVIRRMREEV
jgi:O-antigen/teichoic acid export membrane protein